MNRKAPSNSAIGMYVRDKRTNVLGQITGIEKHKTEPFQRYTVLFDDGTKGEGFIVGTHIKILSFDDVEALGRDGSLRS